MRDAIFRCAASTSPPPQPHLTIAVSSSRTSALAHLLISCRLLPSSPLPIIIIIVRTHLTSPHPHCRLHLHPSPSLVITSSRRHYPNHQHHPPPLLFFVGAVCAFACVNVDALN
ncbi:hypothetical protein L1887_40466 [Cichorium endivia]|nr:hypothetical protein L1887_40466 [Cichorium endivia]